jgi:NAD(P)-dependent dehydrogenase (short-subunit alcohol dehydrogenase family)
MDIAGQSVIITGGASGLGRASAERAAALGAIVTIADLPASAGAGVASALGNEAQFVATDVSDSEQVAALVAAAESKAPLRATIHAAGRGGAVRLVNTDGQPGDAERYAEILKVNLLGSYLISSHSAAAMAGNEAVNGERGVIVMTASAAAFEGQIGQIGYAASKAGVVGMTIVAARDLSSRNIRVCTIAPGIMNTAMLAGLRDDIRESLAATVPNPARLGEADEYAKLAMSIIDNGYLNGETIRLDGAIRMAPR